MKYLTGIRRAALYIFAIIFAHAAASGADAQDTRKTYESQLAGARRFADEKSWVLARDAYGTALKLAPDADAKRWCELWQAQAEWRAMDTNARWRAQDNFEKRAALWCSPYEKQHNENASQSLVSMREKDEFWVEALLCRAEFSHVRDSSAPDWGVWCEVLDYWMAQPPAPLVKNRMMQFLRSADFTDLRAIGHDTMAFARKVISLAESNALSADDRAWCALTGAWMQQELHERRISKEWHPPAWKDISAACSGTRYEAVAEAFVLIHEARADDIREISRIGKSSQAAWKEGYPGLLARAVQLKKKLPGNPDDHLIKMVRNKLARLADDWSRPVLRIDILPTARSHESFKFNVGMARCAHAIAELYAYDMDGFSQRVAEEYRSNHSYNTAQFATVLKAMGARLLQTKALFPDAKADDPAWHSETFQFDQSMLPPGFYMLAVRVADSSTNAQIMTRHFFVTDVRVVAMTSGNGEIDARVLNIGDNSPVANAGVNVRWFQEHWRWDENEAVESSPVWTGTTDAEGKVRVPGAKQDMGSVLFVVNGHPVALNISAVDRFTAAKKIEADLFLDRPLYRPGETVHWKMVAREKNAGRFVVCRQPAKFSVDLSYEKLVVEKALVFDKFGTAHGEIAIPANVRPGRASWDISMGEQSVRLHDSFSVDNFVPPAINAFFELVTPSDSVSPGNDVVFKLKARYYSGGPVIGAPVECRVSVDTPISRYDTDVSNSRESCHEWLMDLGKLTLQGVTNANGEVEFKLNLHGGLGDGSALRIRGDVNAAGMAECSTSATYMLSKAGYSADAADAGKVRLAAPGVESTFFLNVKDVTGVASAFEGTVKFFERRWMEIWLDPEGREVRGDTLSESKKRIMQEIRRAPFRRGDTFDPFTSWKLVSMPHDWTKIHADYVSIPVMEAPVKCGTDGRLEVKFTPPREGIYELQVQHRGIPLWSRDRDMRYYESKDRPQLEDFKRRGMIVFAADAKTASLALKPDDGVILGLENHTTGTPVRLLLALPENCDDAIVSLAWEGGVASRRIKKRNQIEEIAFDNIPEGAGSLHASAFDVGNNLEITSVALSVPEKRAKLAMEIAPEKNAVRPGEKADAAIVVRSFDGKPVQAELAIAVADKAVIEMADGRNAMLREPAFLNTRPAKVTFWAASDSGSSRQTLRPVADPRAGAKLLTFINGKTLEDERPSESFLKNVFGLPEGGVPTSGKAASWLGDKEISMAGPMDSQDGVTVDGLGSRIRLRRHFASTAFWDPELVTDKDGRARVSFTYPDNLTQWRIAAYAVGEDGNTFGTAQALTRTSLPLQARLLAPRFLVEGDEAALPGLFVNRMDADLKISANMKGEGAVALTAATREVVALTQADARASWQVRARAPGEAVLTLAAKATNAPDAADAMRVALPVLEDGTRQDTAACAQVRAGEEGAVMTLPLPNPLNRERLDAELVLAQGRAGVMLDALPYLIDYPYGCVEQTLSRFLPAVVVKKTLADFGCDAAAVERRILPGETRAAQSRRECSAGLQKLDDVVAQSLSRLREAHQYRDGYGWWPGGGDTDLWMTAYVAWGLQLAKESGVTISEDWLKEVREAVRRKIAGEKSTDDRLAWALFVMAEVPAPAFDKDSLAAMKTAYARVYAEREKLSASGRACLLAASARWGSDAERAVLLRNLENGAQRGAWGVHWGAAGGYWRATEGAVESTALTVLALLKVAPGNALAEQALDWLVMNRRGGGWANTRASALAVLALARNEARKGADAQAGGAEVFLNGKRLGAVVFSKKALLAGAARVALPAELLQGGGNRIEVRRVSGVGVDMQGAIYATALASAWARGDSVKPAGSLVSVARDFGGQRIEPTLGGNGRLRATAMAETGVAQAGDEVTARVVLTAPGELEYVMIEVPKPAGCEPLNPLSGWDAELVRVDAEAAGRGEGRRTSRRIYREEHDDRSAFFLDHIDAGTWEIRFRMRAVTPGNFRVLPVKAGAMYAPEIRANSDARRVRIEGT